MFEMETGSAKAPDPHSMERLRLAVDAAGMGEWDWDIATGEVVWSRQCRLLYGLPPDDPIDYQRFLATLHPEDRDSVDLALKRAVEECGVYDEEKRCIWPDGSVHWTASRAQVLCDPSGRPIRMVGVTFDVTARKQAEAELRAREAELRLIVDHVPAKIAYIDANYRLHYANAAFAEFFTGREAGMEGKSIDEALGPYNGERARLLLARALKGENVREEAARRRWDGAERMVDVTLVPNASEGGEVSGVFVFVLDITERVDAERSRLEHARLEAANLELNAFAYTVAHDLSAPLRRIIAFAHLLRESLGNELSLESSHALEKIDASAYRLHELIAALLSYARSAQADLNIVELDLAELAHDAVETLQPDYPGASVRISALPKVKGDRSLMWGVFLNLIGNALKFSSKREAPMIEIGTTLTARGPAVFVRDNGAGFDPAYADKLLFRVFQRLHKESEFPGTGIGLAFVRRVLLRHGADIWAESAPDRGATFYFTLPSSQEPAH